MMKELITQLKVILPLAAMLLLLLMAGHALAWTFCIDIGGGTYCWDMPDYPDE